MVHLHHWCFRLTTVWEKSAKSFTRVWHKLYLKRETFRSRFQVIEFEQKFALGCQIKSVLFKGVQNSMQKKNSGS